jgi:macrodomain Ter protein organizer (MatP/YcbG family)
MGRQAREASDKEPAEGSKQTVESALSRRRGTTDEALAAERLNRLDQRIRDLEKRVFELENRSTDSPSTP